MFWISTHDKLVQLSCMLHFRTCSNHLTDFAKYADNTDDGNDVDCLITLARFGMSGFSCPSASRMLHFHMTSYSSAQSWFGTSRPSARETRLLILSWSYNKFKNTPNKMDIVFPFSKVIWWTNIDAGQDYLTYSLDWYNWSFPRECILIFLSGSTNPGSNPTTGVACFGMMNL